MSTKPRYIFQTCILNIQQWLKELEFWEDEIDLYNRRLGEIIGRYTDPSIKAEMEHFQNQFIRHDEVIDILKHDVQSTNLNSWKYAQDHPVAIDHVHFNDHTSCATAHKTQQDLCTWKQSFTILPIKEYGSRPEVLPHFCFIVVRFDRNGDQTFLFYTFKNLKLISKQKITIHEIVWIYWSFGNKNFIFPTTVKLAKNWFYLIFKLLRGYWFCQ